MECCEFRRHVSAPNYRYQGRKVRNDETDAIESLRYIQPPHPIVT